MSGIGCVGYRPDPTHTPPDYRAVISDTRYTRSPTYPMNTNPDTTPDPTSPPGDAIFVGRPIETAPSQTVAELPTLPRLVGFIGLFFFIVGLSVFISTKILGPRMVSEGWGFLAAALGLTLMLYHAIRDREPEVRRMYGGFAALCLVLGLAAAVVPGPVFEAKASKAIGFNLLPWGVGLGLLGLLFAIPFVRHETDEKLRGYAVTAVMGVGAALAVGSTAIGILNPDHLSGWALALSLLGFAYLCSYLGMVDNTEGVAYQVAVGIGILGAVAVVYALARSVAPTLLFDGPQALRKPNGALDNWKVASRLFAALLFAGVGAVGVVARLPVWVRGTLGLVGVGGLVRVCVLNDATASTISPPKPFFVPGGIILMVLGGLYLAVSLAVTSDNTFVTLTRRELSAFFLSPMGYIVLLAMAIVAGLGYWSFVGQLRDAPQGVMEPIVQRYMLAVIVSIFAVLFLVPALTMRLFAEEWRTGSLEVLLTSPVSEATVVVSKFAAALIFFMVSWLPFGLYMIALRVEGGSPFDYRPLLSFYLILAASGASFVGMGLFFSSLTRNQLIAAVLTFAGMLAQLMTVMVDRFPVFGQLGKTLLSRFSFYELWVQALGGQLIVRDLFLHASLAVFWVFLTIKVLEARKWN